MNPTQYLSKLKCPVHYYESLHAFYDDKFFSQIDDRIVKISSKSPMELEFDLDKVGNIQNGANCDINYVGNVFISYENDNRSLNIACGFYLPKCLMPGKDILSAKNITLGRIGCEDYFLLDHDFKEVQKCPVSLTSLLEGFKKEFSFQ